jgi:hypothetical protein
MCYDCTGRAKTDYVVQQTIAAATVISGKLIITVKDFLLVTAALGVLYLPTGNPYLVKKHYGRVFSNSMLFARATLLLS